MLSISDFFGAFFPDENEDIWILGFLAKKLPDGHPDKDAKFKNRDTQE